jgi:hypothetical protein
MTIFEVIKNKSFERLIDIANSENINQQDQYGRTPLHYAIIQRTPIEVFETLIKLGANPNIEDKLHETVLIKAIKFKDIKAIRRLLDLGMPLNNSHSIKNTPWFVARNSPEMADLMLNTHGSVRLALTKEEKEIIDNFMYFETEEQIKNLYKLNTPVLIHAFVLSFNWDDDLEPIEMILQQPYCQEVTAIEMFELAGGEEWLEQHDIKYDYEKKYKQLIDNILEKFPNIR